MTATRLAQIMFEELDRDDWGDVDPTLFEMIGDGDDLLPDFVAAFGEDNERDCKALRAVLERVLKRVKDER